MSQNVNLQHYLLGITAIHTTRNKDRVEVLIALQLAALLMGGDQHKDRQMGAEGTDMLGEGISGGGDVMVGDHNTTQGGAVAQGGGLLGGGEGEAAERVVQRGHRAGHQGSGLCLCECGGVGVWWDGSVVVRVW